MLFDYIFKTLNFMHYALNFESAQSSSVRNSLNQLQFQSRQNLQQTQVLSLAPVAHGKRDYFSSISGDPSSHRPLQGVAFALGPARQPQQRQRDVGLLCCRYLAVCYPLHVRWLVRVKRTILIDVSIYLFSFVFNTPEFLKYKLLFST